MAHRWHTSSKNPFDSHGRGRSLRASARAFARVCLVLAAAGGLASFTHGPIEAQGQHACLNPYRRDVGRLIKAATSDDFAWRRLAELTDTFGARLSGSPHLARAVQWSVQEMKGDGLEHVRHRAR